MQTSRSRRQRRAAALRCVGLCLALGCAHTAGPGGYGQLDLRLRGDPRVRVLERTNARHLTREQVPEEIDLVTIDVSFISSRLLIERLPEVAPRADVLVMVKPQFELGPGRVGKGGVVRDDGLRHEALEGVAAAALTLGYTRRGQADSRLPGPKGNREIFLWLSPAGSTRD